MNEIVRRDFHAVVKEVDGVKRVMFVASTSDTDRYGDVVDQASWDLANYNANPVVQIDHDYCVESTVGLGKATIGDVDGKPALMLEMVKWSERPMAQEVKMDVEAGILSAVSVGFRPGRAVSRRTYQPEDPLYAEDGGYVYFNCELLEVSIVASPANPRAVAVRSAPSLDIGAIADQVLAQVLSRLTQAQQLAAPVETKKTQSLADFLNNR